MNTGSILLTEGEQEALRKKARKQIDDAKKKEQEKELLEQYLAEERAKSEPEYEMVDISIDLPGNTSFVMINGIKYPHGTKIHVAKHVADSVREQLDWCWKQERVSGNPNLRDYVPVRSDSVSALSSVGKFARG